MYYDMLVKFYLAYSLITASRASACPHESSFGARWRDSLLVSHAWQVRALTAMTEFVQEVKLARRCMALCEIKHCIGDYFALDFTFPSPCFLVEEYKRLVGHPGAVRVTTDETVLWGLSSDGHHVRSVASGGPGNFFRHGLITNVPWLVQLTRDSPPG